MKIGYFNDYRDETSHFFSLISKQGESQLKPIRELSDTEGVNYIIVGGAPKACKDYWNLLQTIIDESHLIKIIFMNTPYNDEGTKERFGNEENVRFLKVGETIKFRD